MELHTLNIKHKADRARMARLVADLASENGATAEITPEGGPYRARRVSVAIQAAGVCASLDFDGDSRSTVHIVHWHGAQRRLDPMFAASVNACHGHKATDLAGSFAGLLDTLEERLEDVASGRAFA